MHDRLMPGSLRAILESNAHALLLRPARQRFPKRQHLRKIIFKRLVNRIAPALISFPLPIERPGKSRHRPQFPICAATSMAARRKIAAASPSVSGQEDFCTARQWPKCGCPGFCIRRPISRPTVSNPGAAARPLLSANRIHPMDRNPKSRAQSNSSKPRHKTPTLILLSMP